MNQRDILLIKLKMKDKGINREALSKKVHVSLYNINKILDGKETIPYAEERLIRWLEKK